MVQHAVVSPSIRTGYSLNAMERVHTLLNFMATTSPLDWKTIQSEVESGES